MSAYGRFPVDLSRSHDREQVVLPATKVATVYCRSLPSPASIHFGQGGEPWELEESTEYEPCPSEQGGIFISNPAGAGTLILMVTYEE